MEARKLSFLKSWFENYVKQFYSNDEKIKANIILKENHTYRVLNLCKQIASSENLGETDINLACAIGLLHDLGRFKQFVKYKTFRDDKSENHAKLGIKVLEEENVLNEIDPKEKNIIKTAISMHNIRKLPHNLSDKKLFYSKLVRDADKLDIWYVVICYYKNLEKNSYQAIGNYISKSHNYTQSIVKSFFNKEMIKYTDVKTISDSKILRLSWIYDLNFSYSYNYLYKKKYIDTIINTLPNNDTTKKIRMNIKIYLQEKFQSSKKETL